MASQRRPDGDPDRPAGGVPGSPVEPGPDPTDRPPGGAAPSSARADRKRSGSEVPPSWLRTSAVVIGAVLLIVLLVLVAAATLPSWWAATIGRQVDGVPAAGTLWGLTYGAIFTVVPMALILVAARARWHWKVRLAVGIAALLVLLPNLLTLAVSLGATETTRGARTLLAVQAPNFRTATLIGVVTTAILGGGAALLIYRMRASRRELTNLREQARDH